MGKAVDVERRLQFILGFWQALGPLLKQIQTMDSLRELAD